jgi:hypothetical protein
MLSGRVGTLKLWWNLSESDKQSLLGDEPRTKIADHVLCFVQLLRHPDGQHLLLFSNVSQFD